MRWQILYTRHIHIHIYLICIYIHTHSRQPWLWQSSFNNSIGKHTRNRATSVLGRKEESEGEKKCNTIHMMYMHMCVCWPCQHLQSYILRKRSHLSCLRISFIFLLRSLRFKLIFLSVSAQQQQEQCCIANNKQTLATQSALYGKWQKCV